METNTLFTGGPAPERGASLVEQHKARQRKENDEAALAELHVACPGFPLPLCRLALELTDCSVGAARLHLLAFAEQERSRSAAGAQLERQEAGSDEERHRKRRKEKHRHRDREKEKRPAKEPEAAFGRFGIVRSEDLWSKQPEFNSWLMEVKQRNPEALPKWEEKELFATFAEEHNTASFPHEKYYNLDKWHAKQAAEAARNGGIVEAAVDFSRLEEDRRRELESERSRSKDAAQAKLLEHMRLMGKLDGLREQQALQTQLHLAGQLGDWEKVKELQKTLAPDDPRKGLAGQGMGYGFKPS
jgi:hypothetical protein